MPDVQGLVWHGTTTARTEEMVRFCREVLELNKGIVQQEGSITRFELQNGDAFVVLPAPKPGQPAVYRQPAFGFLVPDVQIAYDDMKAKGAEFLGPVHKGSSATWADAWAHFRAPDGFVYALVSRPKAYPGGAKRKFGELRICFAVDDLDRAKELYGDGLGLGVVDEWTHPGGERGALMAVCPASLEFVRNAGAPPAVLRIECDDAERSAAELESSGFSFAEPSQPRRDTRREIAIRAPEPQGVQLTLFEALPGSAEARRADRALLPK